MSFDLYVTISGLCLLATTPKGDQLHVLMPVTDKEHQGCGKKEKVMKHAPVLTYNALYEGAATPPNTPGKDVVNIGIEGLGISFGDQTTPSINVALGPDVANLTAVSGAKVPSSLITGALDPKLAARVSFFTGQLSPSNPYEVGDAWDFGGRTHVYLATGVRLLIHVADNHVDIKTVRGTKSLYPISGSVAIAFFHLPPNELPGQFGPPFMPPPKEGDVAPHFPAYYSLAQPISDKCPIYNGSRGIYTPTCLVSTAEIGP
jgi:hypothetical protein